MKNSLEPNVTSETLDEKKLEQVSGGSLLNSYKEGVDIFNLLSKHVNAILAPFADDLASAESQIRYKNILKTMQTYDTSQLSIESKADFLADSWNKKHEGQNMTPKLAKLIIGMEDKYDRAAIMCLPTVDDMMEALNQIYG